MKKHIAFWIMIILGYLWTTCSAQDYTVNYYIEDRNKNHYEVELNGKAHLSIDSVAIHLYEPVMQSLILTNVSKLGNTYIGYTEGYSREISVTKIGNVLLVKWGKMNSKIFLN